MKVLCVGHLAYDFTCNVDSMPVENTKSHFKADNAHAGGFGANTSCLLGKYGVETYLSSAVGDDTYGTKIREELKLNQVHLDYVETLYSNETSFSLILNNAPNRTVYGVSNEPLFKKKNDINIKPDIILTDSYDYNMILDIIEKFKDSITIVDADKYNDSTKEICKRVKYIIASKTFAENATQIKLDVKDSNSLASAYASLLKQFPDKIIIVTLEDYGALYMIDNQVRIMPGLQVEPKDTTGAGDIFRAGFVFAMAQNYDFEKCITFANIAAGLSTRNLGGASSIPDLTEVNSYMASKYEIKNDNNTQNANA